MVDASDVHYGSNLGRFVATPDIFEAQANLVKDPGNRLAFDPARYPNFDGIIAQKFPAIMQPQHEGLRVNLAVMRNDITGHYLQDGAGHTDAAFVPHMRGMATELGQALANDTWHKRGFTRWLSADVANVEGVGATKMYEHLLSLQHRPGMFQTLMENIRSQLRLTSRYWKLPPIEQTPFSPRGLATPAFDTIPAPQQGTYFQDYVTGRAAELAYPTRS